MDDPAASHPRGRSAPVAGTVFLVLALYVLSPGPVVCLLRRWHHPVPPAWAVTLYMPLGLAFDMLPHGVQNAYERYVRWWDGSGGP